MSIKVNIYLTIFSLYILACITVTNTCLLGNSNWFGECSEINKCPNLFSNLRSTFPPPLCKSKGNIPQVCCPDRHREQKRVSGNSSRRRIVNLCYQEYAQRKSNTGLFCNYENDCSVVLNCASPSGGIKAAILDHMYTATLGWRVSRGKYDFRCGGFLIARNYVLTAAHCLGPDPDIVRMGDKVYSKELSQDIAVARTYPHPDYNFPEVYNDIALLRLAKGADHRFYLACLWDDNISLLSSVRAIGFGATSFTGNPTDTLYQVELNLMDRQVCSRQFGGTYRTPRGITDSLICAGDPRGRMDTCKGDSGGPLFTKFNLVISPTCKHQENIAHVLGITSNGQACGQSQAALYTRISSYFDWIEGIIFRK